MRYTKYITYILLLLLYGHFSSCSVEEEDQLLLSSSSGSFSTLGTVVNTEQLTIDSDTYGALLPVNTHIFTDNKVNILGQRVLLEVCKHSIFRHDNFIGCFSADKIKMSARKYFCFNIPIDKNMAEGLFCRSPYHEEYIQTSASGNPEDLCH